MLAETTVSQNIMVFKWNFQQLATQRLKFGRLMTHFYKYLLFNNKCSEKKKTQFTFLLNDFHSELSYPKQFFNLSKVWTHKHFIVTCSFGNSSPFHKCMHLLSYNFHVCYILHRNFLFPLICYYRNDKVDEGYEVLGGGIGIERTWELF